MILITVTTYNQAGSALNYNRDFETLDLALEWLNTPRARELILSADEVNIIVNREAFAAAAMMKKSA